MQFSTDLALMNTQPQRIKVDDATRTNDNRGIPWCSDSCKGKLLNLVSLTNLFEMLYPRLVSYKKGIIFKSENNVIGNRIFVNKDVSMCTLFMYYKIYLLNMISEKTPNICRANR